MLSYYEAAYLRPLVWCDYAAADSLRPGILDSSASEILTPLRAVACEMCCLHGGAESMAMARRLAINAGPGCAVCSWAARR